MVVGNSRNAPSKSVITLVLARGVMFDGRGVVAGPGTDGCRARACSGDPQSSLAIVWRRVCRRNRRRARLSAGASGSGSWRRLNAGDEPTAALTLNPRPWPGCGIGKLVTPLLRMHFGRTRARRGRRRARTRRSPVETVVGAVVVVRVVAAVARRVLRGAGAGGCRWPSPPSRSPPAVLRSPAPRRRRSQRLHAVGRWRSALSLGGHSALTSDCVQLWARSTRPLVSARFPLAASGSGEPRVA